MSDPCRARMRVLLDISTLGLAQLHPEMRGGSFRVHGHLAEGLASSPDCQLLFCANDSSFAYQGCMEYLRTSERLTGVPLVGSSVAWAPQLRGAMSLVRSSARRFFPHAFPALIRDGGRYLDRQIHPVVTDASPPVDVFHSPGTRLPPHPKRGRSPQRFLSIYDLIPFRFPELCDDLLVHWLSGLIGSLCEEDWVMAPSEATRADLCEHDVASPERIFVVPLAADPERFYPCAEPGRAAALREWLGIGTRPYLLALNTIDVRKNMEGVVRAFVQAVRQERISDLTLVLAGHPGGGSERLTAVLEEAGEVRERVVLPGYVPDPELAPLYSGALGFVYPSFYEGFGLPPLEAMQCGTPVITSRTSSLPEVVGEAGILVDPHDCDALSQAMLQLYRDATLRERLHQASLQRAAQFSRERFIRETLAAYRAALSS
ncbi:MAG TPA: glycosyltransferase family 1 protein [Longimicrobiaceae bacterium]|nr:glycosyltransferase family 1 protein [Longimicrobiaceae bacterium]